jgi:hypothetical protein
MSTRTLTLPRAALSGALPAPHRAEPLAPARGILLGVLLSVSAWAGLFLLLG